MKKITIFLITSFFLLNFISFNVSATETDEEYYSELLESVIDSDTLESLEEIGVESFTSDEIFSVSFSRVGEYFSTGLKEKSESIISAFFRMLCVLIIVITVKAFLWEDKDNSIIIIGVIAVTVLSVDICGSVLEMLLSTMKTSGSFMLAFIPIYTVILSLAGNVSSALTYNTVTFTLAQIFSVIINTLAVDLTCIFLSLSMAFSLNSGMNLNRFISTVNKLVSTVLGFFASCFTAVLSVRGILSAAIDSVSSKSIKFLIGSLIPIVGSSISDAYSTILGSINVIKGSVAVAGIIVMIIIVVPPILEGIIYCIGFTFLSYISEISELNEVSAVLKDFHSALRTVILLNVFQMFILIVSTGIMVAVKGGG